MSFHDGIAALRADAKACNARLRGVLTATEFGPGKRRNGEQGAVRTLRSIEAGNTCVNSIAADTGISLTGAVGRLRKAIADGLIERQALGRKPHRYSVTAKGREWLKEQEETRPTEGAG